MENPNMLYMIYSPIMVFLWNELYRFFPFSIDISGHNYLSFYF